MRSEANILNDSTEDHAKHEKETGFRHQLIKWGKVEEDVADGSRHEESVGTGIKCHIIEITAGIDSGGTHMDIAM